MAELYSNTEHTEVIDLLSQLWQLGDIGRVQAILGHILWKSTKDIGAQIRLVRNELHGGGSAGLESVSKHLVDSAQASTALAQQLHASSKEWVDEITAANRSATRIAQRLVWATWALVFATVVLIVVTGLQSR